MTSDIVVVAELPTGRTLEIAPNVESLRWSSAAVGGFADAAGMLRGLREPLPHLTRVTILWGSTVLWQGRVEDKSIRMQKRDQGFDVGFTGFGYRRLLEDVSVRRIWSTRDFVWTNLSSSISNLVYTPSQWAALSGEYDTSDATKRGVYIRSTVGGGTADANSGHGGYLTMPAGHTAIRVMGTKETGTDDFNHVEALYKNTSSLAAAWSSVQDWVSTNSAVAFDIAVASAKYIAFAQRQTVLAGSGDLIFAKFYNIRVLCTTVTEDASGGFYGGTILRDLIALVPGLTVGTIENGSDFTIESLERAVRSTSLSVVQEVASYYDRFWGVWEEGRVDWTGRNLDIPDYVVNLSQCENLDLQFTVDDLEKTSYVLYTDAATGAPSEASATSTSRLNPFVRSGAAKDGVHSASAQMTANTAAALASRVNGDYGSFPSVSGRIVLPPEAMVGGVRSDRVPALALRAGKTIVLPELPSTTWMQAAGRDGETLFHINSCSVDMAKRRVTLEVSSQLRSTDVLLARLAAVTRTLNA